MYNVCGQLITSGWHNEVINHNKNGTTNTFCKRKTIRNFRVRLCSVTKLL